MGRVRGMPHYDIAQVEEQTCAGAMLFSRTCASPDLEPKNVKFA